MISALLFGNMDKTDNLNETYHGCIKSREELVESLVWIVVALVCVTQQLEGRDTVEQVTNTLYYVLNMSCLTFYLQC